jgi:arylsulfatase A
MTSLTQLSWLLCCTTAVLAQDTPRPNIIHILCDDLGYGDVKALNPAGKISTPQLDRIAAQGMIFTDAHSPSSVCSPTRYGVMTGRYNWRTKLQSGVLGGLSPRLIEPGRLTVADVAKKAGYATACIGKWHLGMGMTVKPGSTVSELNIESPEQANSVDFTKPITDGPNAVGFDYYYGISASLDMVPYCFIENTKVTAQPTERGLLQMNGSQAGATTREGPMAPGFKGEDVLPSIISHAVGYIQEHSKQPFFIYLPLNSPHTPILPTAQWRGRSGISLYADFVMQTDDAIGQVISALEKAGIADNTLVIVTSDNGCSPQANFPQLAEHGHNPSHVFRGNKADIFDGGHRVPYLIQWPAVVKGGSRCDQTVCLVDFMATVAEILGQRLPADAAEDSYSYLSQLRGELTKPIRPNIVHHSINGSFAIREGSWKLELCPDSGGWSPPRPSAPGKAKGKVKAKPTAEALPPLQLYDLSTDIGERSNLAEQQPEKVSQLTKILEQLVQNGRSTPGAPQKNTVEPNLWKFAPRPVGL